MTITFPLAFPIVNYVSNIFSLYKNFKIYISQNESEYLYFISDMNITSIW